MTTPIFVVDAFTERLFAGNPAAVCPLDAWLDDATLQAIAVENNLSETAFVVARADESDAPSYDLRWFTPGAEVDLCGHATLAAAHVVCTELHPDAGEVAFHTRSGALPVTRDGAAYTLDFPTTTLENCDAPAAVWEALGVAARRTLSAGRDYLVELPRASDVAALDPDMRELARADRPVIATAVADDADDADFVSRFFAPGLGVDEDPVTGSAHCALAPYWSEKLGKAALIGRQVSSRGGVVHCELVGDRTRLRGSAVLYLRGSIEV